AAMDLGANEGTTFRKATLPLTAPAILAALLRCFALSIDDFVVTYFNSGSEVTIRLFVWGAARIGAPAQVNVIGTAIFVVALAAELASLAPGDLTRAFFVSGGSEGVESAWKLARQYHAARGERRWKAVSRNVAYHGTTMGALSINGIPAVRAPFEPLVPEVVH